MKTRYRATITVVSKIPICFHFNVPESNTDEG